MAKCQKLSSLQFEDLPNEMILKIFNYLDIKDVANCVTVSKRMRKICEDLKIFEKINLYNKKVPSGFVQLILNFGCKYLCLNYADIREGSTALSVEKPSKLVYLDLFCAESGKQDIEEILVSCHSLKKLSLGLFSLTPKMINSICHQNGKTLEILNLHDCRVQNYPGIYRIFKYCLELKELNIGFTFRCNLKEKELRVLGQMIPSKIEKLCIGGNRIDDQFLNDVFTRCQNLKSLDLQWTSGITSQTVTLIVNHLKHTLEELDLTGFKAITKTPMKKLLEFKSMQNLRILCLCGFDHELMPLTNSLPKLTRPINQIENAGLDIAFSTAYDDPPKNGFWDVNAKQMKLFEKNCPCDPHDL